MEVQHLQALMREAQRFDAGWWKDDRRNWCAYCGIPMRKKAALGKTLPPTKATRDHVIPKAHNGGYITIPACRACNSAKGAMSLPEYLDSAHFKASRIRKHGHQWPLDQLWAVAGVAALKRSLALSVAASPMPSAKSPALPATADRTR